MILPKDVAALVPKERLMSEAEWRKLGVQQSRGWVHYMMHRPGTIIARTCQNVIVFMFPSPHRASYLAIQTPKTYQQVKNPQDDSVVYHVQLVSNR